MMRSGRRCEAAREGSKQGAGEGGGEGQQYTPHVRACVCVSGRVQAGLPPVLDTRNEQPSRV